MLAEMFSVTESEGITRAIKLWFKASNHTRADLLGLAAQNHGETHLRTNWGEGGRWRCRVLNKKAIRQACYQRRANAREIETGVVRDPLNKARTGQLNIPERRGSVRQSLLIGISEGMLVPQMKCLQFTVILSSLTQPHRTSRYLTVQPQQPSTSHDRRTAAFPLLRAGDRSRVTPWEEPPTPTNPRSDLLGFVKFHGIPWS